MKKFVALIITLLLVLGGAATLAVKADNGIIATYEPLTMLLLGICLIGLAYIGRKKLGQWNK